MPEADPYPGRKYRIVTEGSPLVGGIDAVVCGDAIGEKIQVEAGIHQDAMLKDRTTYEIMTPDSVGWGDTKIVLGRHSGRHGLKSRLQDLGYKLNKEELDKVYERFLDVADKKKEVFDADLEALVGDEVQDFEEAAKLRDRIQELATGRPTETPARESEA